MNVLQELQALNYLAVLVATLASYLLGFFWYHWGVFGRCWANSLSLTKEEADNTQGLGWAFFISLTSGAVKALWVAFLLSLAGISGVLSGALFAATLAVAFTATSIGYYNGFARLPSRFTCINGAHSVAELALIGAVIGLFS
ncbi:DUF1761 domain-containing protein [Motilimonas pumila]|uniref:DUF1761 domain-containing protein n=1 Tax=Motilimonas pumila TaxID=2303987 RepID=A0A418YAI3_9GAMM|nr:DUF1761 domain-containing protein [Motilimonas pumila]RJG39982.1 DUF1761 domain-containing protein [Motilimonas pumila]